MIVLIRITEAWEDRGFVIHGKTYLEVSSKFGVLNIWYRHLCLPSSLTVFPSWSSSSLSRKEEKQYKKDIILSYVHYLSGILWIITHPATTHVVYGYQTARLLQSSTRKTIVTVHNFQRCNQNNICQNFIGQHQENFTNLIDTIQLHLGGANFRLLTRPMTGRCGRFS